jgi:Na+/H+ antiporter NhaD/arsenite permease-like protein
MGGVGVVKRGYWPREGRTGSLFRILKNEFVLVASGMAAAVSACFVPISYSYIGYIDFKVIAILFCLMAVVAGIRKLRAFEVLAQSMLQKTGSVRKISLALILMSFFSSMLITNDVALITFVPFTIAVLSFSGKKNIIFVITMQTMAANLGSMLTPVGNPQNLYLYSFFNLEAKDFFFVTMPIVLVSLAIIIVMTILARDSTISVDFPEDARIESWSKLNIFLVLFALCLMSVFGLVSYILVTITVFVVLLMIDRELFIKVDYSLLATFVFFFILVGNIGQLSHVENTVGGLIKGREMISAVLLSQVISNVPAAIMLSGFTKNYAMLIAGTNIGGLGTMVASLASLISFKFYLTTDGAEPVRYMGVFTAANLVVLGALLAFAFVWY